MPKSFLLLNGKQGAGFLNAESSPTIDAIDVTDHPQLGLIREQFSNWLVDGSTLSYLPQHCPGPNYTLVDGVYTLDAASLTAAQANVWEKIKALRDTRKYEGIQVNTGAQGVVWIHSDQASRIQHLGLLGASILHILKTFFNVPGIPGFPEGQYWKTLSKNPDGSPKMILLDYVIALQIFAADMQLEGTNFGVASYHQTEMLKLSNPEAYNFQVGWPKVFGE